MTHFDIDISLNHENWRNSLENIEDYTVAVIKNILEHLLKSTEQIEISIVLADNSFIQELNKTYRQKDKATNVLSFPQTDPQEQLDDLPFISLGDIIIAFETIESEAKEQNKTLKNHYTHMLVHSCLHLLHYDHETDDEAEQMETLEIQILGNLGIKNPYQEL